MEKSQHHAEGCHATQYPNSPIPLHNYSSLHCLLESLTLFIRSPCLALDFWRKFQPQACPFSACTQSHPLPPWPLVSKDDVSLFSLRAKLSLRYIAYLSPRTCFWKFLEMSLQCVLTGLLRRLFAFSPELFQSSVGPSVFLHYHNLLSLLFILISHLWRLPLPISICLTSKISDIWLQIPLLLYNL